MSGTRPQFCSLCYTRNTVYLVSSSGKLVSNIVTILVVVFCHGHFGIQAVAAGMLFGNLVTLSF